jgi:hypothetical protein
MGWSGIDQAYDHFKDNNPQFNTQPGSIGQVANDINKSGQPLQDPTKYTPNPYLPQMADAMTNQVTQNLNRNIMLRTYEGYPLADFDDTAEREYRLAPNDMLMVRVFANERPKADSTLGEG